LLQKFFILTFAIRFKQDNFQITTNMNLEITGKLVSFLPEQTGQGKNGPWVKQEAILETEEQYPKRICVACWGDKASAVKAFSLGEKLKIGINIESREFNGRWYTDVKAWRIERAGASTMAETSNHAPAPLVDDASFDSIPAEDDLPF
jgi:hypothetical protein